MFTIHRVMAVCLLLASTSAGAAVTKIPYKEGILLNPGESQTVSIASDVPLEVGWKAVQERKCTMNCVEAVDKTGGQDLAIATDIGAYLKYTPYNGTITVEYRNKADHPVEINVYTMKRTCDAESCRFLGNKEDGRWLVYKIARFNSIETSKDLSYSTITGVTTTGKAFSVKAVWWSDNNNGLFQCYKSIGRYLKDNVPDSEYAPYILAGKTLGGDDSILQSVDTCSPKSPKFGVPDENVFDVGDRSQIHSRFPILTKASTASFLA